MKDRKRVWEIKQSATPDTLDIYIYGVVESDYYDWWHDKEVESETSANHFRNELAKHPSVKNINLYINSNGGDVMEGVAIGSQLKRHSAYVTAYIDGFACSIASVIAMAADRVLMYRNTSMMIHNIRMYCFGNSAELRKAADDVDVLMESSRQAYMARAKNLTEEKLTEMLNAETWLTAQQCLEYGFCDEIIDEDRDTEEMQKYLNRANTNMQQKLAAYKLFSSELRQLIEAKLPVTPEPQPIEKTFKQKMSAIADFFN